MKEFIKSLSTEIILLVILNLRLEEFVKKGIHLRGAPTGFAGLDQKLSGMQPSNLLIIAARPAIGKTTLALNIALHVALKEKLPVGFVSSR